MAAGAQNPPVVVPNLAAIQAAAAQAVSAAATVSAVALVSRDAANRLPSGYLTTAVDPLAGDRVLATGPATPSTGTAAPAGTYFLSDMPLPAGPLSTFSFFAAASGKTVKVKRFKRDGVNHTFVSEIAVTSTAVGLNTFSLAAGTLPSLHFDEGEVQAVYLPTGAGFYTTGTDPSGTEYFYSASDITTTFAASGSVSSAVTLQVRLEISSPKAAQDVLPLVRAQQGRTIKIGPPTPAVANGYVTKNRHFWETTQLTEPRLLDTVELYSETAGTALVTIGELTADKSSFVTTHKLLLRFAAGYNLLLAGVHFPPGIVAPEGAILGHYLPNSNPNAGLRLDTTYGGQGGYWYTIGLTPDAFNQTTLANFDAAGWHQISFGLTAIKPARSRTYLFDHTFLTAIPYALKSAGWQVTGGRAVNTTTGLTTAIMYPGSGSTGGATKVNGTVTWQGQLAANSAVAIGRKPASNYNGGSVLTIENTTGVVGFRGQLAGNATTLPAMSTVTQTVSWLVGNTNPLRVDEVKNYRQISATITDRITNNTVTLSYDGSINETTVGMMMGSPFVSATTGTVYTDRLRFKPGKKDCNVLVFGDSRTQGSLATTDAQCAAIAMCELANGLTSAKGGETSINVLTAFRDEVLFYMPRHVVVNIGTNDTDMTVWQANLTIMEQITRSIGATFWACTLPPETADSNPVSVMNPWLRTTGWRLIEVDRALTTNGDGSTRNESLFGDALHENNAGHAAVLARMKLDAAPIFDDAA